MNQSHQRHQWKEFNTTFDEFIAKWTGQTVDFDGVYPNQCMDLMHQYVYDVLGVTDKTVLAKPAAYQVYTEFQWQDLFEQIDNTPDGVPQKGDIVFFGQQIGPFGHVCIFIDGDSNQFNSFDANWPIGSLPHVQNHNYTGVLGWLRYKGPQAPQQVQVDSAVFQELVRKSTEYDKFVAGGYNTIDDISKKVLDLQSQVTQLENELSQANKDAAVIADQYAQLKTDDSDLGIRNVDLNHQVTDLQNTLQALYNALEAHDLTTALSSIDSLKTAHTEVVKNTIPVMDQMFQNLVRGKKTQTFIDKILFWLR